jgi:hypothetical protein
MKIKSVLNLTGRITSLIILLGIVFAAPLVNADQWGDWTYTVSGSNVTITGYGGTNTEILIPDAISNMTVVAIGYAAFNPHLTVGGPGVPTLPTKVTIPETVTDVGDNAFYYCPLTNIALNEGLVRIGSYAFNNCPVTNVVIPHSVASIGMCAFGCVNLTSLTLGSNLMTIGEAAFSGTKISSVTLPPKVASLEQGVFAGCANLTNIVLPDGLISIGMMSFFNCQNLVTVTMGSNLVTIGDSAFDSCTSLSKIMIPTNVVYIGACSFYSNSSLTSVDIPDSVTNIGWAAFAYCDSLTNIHIGSGANTIYGRAFSYCSNLTSITVSEENPLITSIDGVVFTKDLIWLLQYPEGKSGSYVVPQGINKIGFETFSYCIGLTNITFPDSVQLLFDWAIDNCPMLTSVVFKGDQPEIRSLDLNSSPNLTVYYYPWTIGWTDTFGGRPTQVNPAYTQFLNNYGFTTNLTDDNDNDGMLNWQEYLSHTDPTTNIDLLAITSMGTDTNAQISWLAKSNVSYQVMKSHDLMDVWSNAPSGTGTNQQSYQTAPVDGILQYADPSVAVMTNAFYRVNVVP